jgi:PDZ-binding kinase
MERSPLSSGQIRSPWAIKKISKIRESKDIYAKRLELEAEILRRLDHPNIIGYRAFGNPSTEGIFLAMEKAPNCLGELIDERAQELPPDDLTPFPAKDIERVGHDIAKALSYLHHEKRIIHGDLKSANVLIFGEFEKAKLCDFGVSRKIKPDGTLEGRYVGTEIWNPMEVILENKGN